MIGFLEGCLIGIPLSQAIGMSDGFAMMFCLGLSILMGCFL